MSGGQFNNLDFISFVNKTIISQSTQTLTAISNASATSLAISGISSSNPAVFTSAVHSFLTGQTVTITATDSTPVLDGIFIVNVLSTTTFTVSLNGIIQSTTIAGTTGSVIATFALITLAGHGIEDGRNVTVASSDSTPVIDGVHVANVLSESIFEVPVATTVIGTTGTVQSELGTDELPQHVTYYASPSINIVSITLASPAILTTNSPHGLVTGDQIYIIDTDSTPPINGGRVVTVLSYTTFSVGVNTTGAGTINTGSIYIEKYRVKDIVIDAYIDGKFSANDSAGDPVYKGTVLPGHKLNLAEGRFELADDNKVDKLIITNDIRMAHIIDSRFTSIVQSGHSTTVPSTMADLNDTGNANFLMETTATTLDIVSTDAADTIAAGAGIGGIAIIGLDQNLDVITDVVFLNGTTPVTSNLSFRTINTSVAIAGGTPGSGAVGDITLTGTVGGQIFAKYLITDTSAEVGRYTVPTGYTLCLIDFLSNTALNGDMTLISEITQPGGAFPISLGEVYSQQNNFQARFLLVSGTMIKNRAFTNSGSPATRKLYGTFIGQLAPNEVWASLLN